MADSPAGADEYTQEGWRLYVAKDYRGAEAAFRKALETSENQADAQYGLALATLRAGRTAEGLDLLVKTRALEMPTENSRALRHRAMLNLMIDSHIAILTGTAVAGG